MAAPNLVGYMFACDNATEEECFNRGLFGGKGTMKRAEDITPGLLLLLYNVDSKTLSGPYTAASHEREHQPDAWGGAFPRQVRVDKHRGWRSTALAVTVPRGTRGLNSGPLSQARLSRLMAMLGAQGYSAAMEPESCGSGKRKRASDAMVLKLFHGTSVRIAERIYMTGFEASTAGALGPGVYLARKDKAERFARDFGRHGGEGGGAIVEVIAHIYRPKYVSQDDLHGQWRAEGFDAVRTDKTSFSINMEWCIADPRNVDIVRWYEVDGSAGGGAAE